MVTPKTKHYFFKRASTCVKENSKNNSREPLPTHMHHISFRLLIFSAPIPGFFGLADDGNVMVHS